jgi:hypothetical protein
MVQSVDHLPIPKPYVAVLRRFNGAKFHAIDLFGMLEDDPIRGVVNHWISQIGSGSMNITDYPKVRSTLGSGRFLIEKTSATFTTHR